MKLLKESIEKLNKVKEAVRLLDSISPDVFYPALAIYEWSFESRDTEISEDTLDKLEDFLDGVDTIYDEYVREEGRNILNGEEIEESCKSKKKSKKLNETWKGEDVITDLVDRAQGLIDDGNYGDVDDCIRQAIDDGLIYSRDIWDLAEHYGVVDDSELIERYYEELFSDIYSRVEEKEEDAEIDESFEEEQKKAEERAKKETIKRMVAEREKGSLGDRIEASELKKELDKSLKESNEDKKYKWYGWFLNDNDELEISIIDKNDNEKLLATISDCGGKTKRELDNLAQEVIEENDYTRISESLKEDIDNEKIDESLHVEIDEDTALDMLMSRLNHWTQDPITGELYEQMYQSYVDGGVFDGGEFDPMIIVDNDWVNYCEIVEPGDEEHHYDELLKLYEEQGLGDVSTEDVGFSYIEAAVERNGKVYFLCRW